MKNRQTEKYNPPDGEPELPLYLWEKGFKLFNLYAEMFRKDFYYNKSNYNIHTYIHIYIYIDTCEEENGWGTISTLGGKPAVIISTHLVIHTSSLLLYRHGWCKQFKDCH